jgi:TPR repeat protein
VPDMLRWCPIVFLLLVSAQAAPFPEWEPYEKTGLFPKGSTLWLAPDMEKEPIASYTARLLDGARGGDAKAMATLGRFFFVRGDVDRAGEWLGKAARIGHAGAQLDYGVLRLRGTGGEANMIEGYAWLWLASWSDAPGADAMLRKVSPQFSMAQVIAAVQLAAKLQPPAR